MKILYLITQSEWGGAQRYVFDLATNFQDEFDVVVACGGAGELKKRLEQHGVQCVTLKHLVRKISPWKDWLAFWEIYRLIRQEQPDVLHTNSSKAEILGNVAGKLAGVKKIIFTAHGFVFNEELGWWKKQFYIFWEKLAARFANRIICVSEFDRQTALKNKITRAEKLIVIHNGIPVRNELRNQLRNSNNTGKIIIGTIANFYPNKGLTYLVHAAEILNKQFNNLEFWIIGDGGERHQIEELIEKSKLRNIHLLGFRKKPEEELQQMDIFVLPSLKEGLPYAVLEAMIAGVPVVASRVGGIPEMIDDGQSGFLVDAKNVPQLAEKIARLVENHELCVKFGAAGRARAEQKFILGRMLQITEKIYRV